MAGMTATPIVALDVPCAGDALALVRLLGEGCRFYKVGSELFTSEGPSIVKAVRAEGCEVFLDLKFHDIPNTVREAARAAASLGVRLLTVHASGGAEMVRAAVEGAGAGCGVLGVTVLTSLDSAALGSAWGRDELRVDDEVLRLAGLAAAAGAHGVVCSGREAAQLHAAFGAGLALLIPGIRLAGGDAHDQARTSTPAAAAAAGARYLILGRAVTGAPDPAAAMRRVNRELGLIT
ncbi:MAG TPA: orotidine-5'-phosphate decarboxylase [Gemmatimonadaceae bacterium]|nr:orotidine-5'-phosphate decarboxylase [Gemmatimonadaceae bacterium]